jgi:hypothetical protein
MAISILLLFLTIAGIYYIMVYVLKISRGACLVVLIPTLLLCLPAILYGCHIRYKRYSENNSYSYKKIFFERRLDIAIMLAYALILLIVLLLGLYFFIYLGIPLIAMIFIGIAVFIAMIIIKKVQKFLKEKCGERSGRC